MLTPDDFRPFLWMLNKKLHEKGKSLCVEFNVETNEVKSVRLDDWNGSAQHHETADSHDRAHRIAIFEEACAEAREMRKEPIAAQEGASFETGDAKPVWQSIDALIAAGNELLYTARRQ